jgi:RHS repeat-associated protein
MKIRSAIILIATAFLLLAYTQSYAAVSVRVTAPAPGSVITGAFDLYGTATFNATASPVKGYVTCNIVDSYSIPVVNNQQFQCKTTTCEFSYKATTSSLIELDDGEYTLTCTTTAGVSDSFTFTVGAVKDKPAGDCGNPKKPGKPNDPCANGAGSPTWQVNPVNLNLYAVDIPLWYTPAYGPYIDIQLSYNSLTSTVSNSPFGTKWQLGYSSYLTENTDSSVTVFMPDGRQDIYTAGGSAYTRPMGVFNTLVKTATHAYTLTFLDGTVYTYGIPAGTTLTNPVLLSIADAYGQAMTISYDSSNRISTIQDALGKETSFSYNANGYVETVTDPFERSAGFEYDTSGRLTKATDMGGYYASYTYDTNGYLASVTTPKGTWTFKTEPSDSASGAAAYPAPDAAMGKKYRITITNPLSGKKEYFYDGTNTWYVSPRDYIAYQDETVNNRNRAVKTYYTMERYPSGSSSPKGRIFKITTPERNKKTYYYDDSTGANKITGYSYTDTGRVITVTDGNSHTVKYAYNTNGFRTKYWDAKTEMSSSSNVELAYYSNNVDLQTATNGLGSVAYEYNTAHDITKITDRMGYITVLTYNSYGQLSTITEAQGTSNETLTELVYDADTHKLTSIKKAGVVIATLTHDAIGRIKTVTYPDGVVISYEYDNLDQTKTITYPDARTEIISNSTLCPYLVDSVTDRAGRTTSYQYDALKRLYQRVGPEGIYLYGYDANSNLKTFTDANSKVTSFDYNLDNRLIKKTYADSKYASYTYDSAGLLSAYINGRLSTTTYGYDANNNLTSITYPTGTTNITFGYDAYNRLTSRIDAIGTFGYSYDANNRLKTVTYPWDSGATITYDYNELNQLTGITPLLGTAVGYTYDTMGRLKTIQRSTDTTPFTYGYDTTNLANPLVQKLTRPNGSYTQYEYNDQLKKLTSIINRTSANAVINRYDYTYTNPSHPDLRNSETITSGTVIDNFAAGTTTYTPNTVNQITASTNPSRTYVYDNDGNMTTGFNPDSKTMTMTYDAEDRLSSAQYTDSSSIIQKTTYDYGGDGLLAVMYKYSGGVLQTTTRYVRAGFLPIQERDAGNNVTREYTWGLNYGGGIGGLLNLKQGGNDYNYLYDGKGNVTALIDSTQSPVVTYAYDPFGVRMKQVGTFEQPYQFSTKPYDPQTGLSNFGFRYYNAGLGKWLTRDPLGEKGGINLYGFVGGNPVNFVDPLGLEQVFLFPINNFTNISHLLGAASFPDTPGLMQVHGHGSQYTVAGMSAEALAEKLQAAGWEPGMPVVLYACNTAKGKNNIARQLAQILKTRVTGVDSPMYLFWPFHEDGDSMPNLTHPGNWITYGPNRRRL